MNYLQSIVTHPVVFWLSAVIVVAYAFSLLTAFRGWIREVESRLLDLDSRVAELEPSVDSADEDDIQPFDVTSTSSGMAFDFESADSETIDTDDYSDPYPASVQSEVEP